MPQSPRAHTRLDAERLLPRLDSLVDSGCLTDGEADSLRAIADEAAIDEWARRIQLRHARSRVRAAMAAGSLTPHDAGAILDRIDAGEDPSFLRHVLRRQS